MGIEGGVAGDVCHDVMGSEDLQNPCFLELYE